MVFNFLRFAIGFSIALIASMIFFGFTIGDFQRWLAPKTDYNGTNAHYHHLMITQSTRLVGTPFYNATHRYLMKVSEDIVEKCGKSKHVSCEIEYFNADVSQTSGSGNNHRQNGIQTIAIHFKPRDATLAAKKPLMFSAHYDGHNVGGTAYDNAINVAMILEIANTIPRVDYPPPVPVTVSLIGSEEMGLSGVKAWVKHHSNWTNVMNLDALGTGQPFALLIKQDRSASVQLSASRVPGIMLASFGSFFMTTGIVSSSTDSVEYNKAGFSGAEMDFVGNPSHYHTELDRMKGPEDITTCGSQLYYFMKNFKEHSNEENWAMIGINPIIICLPNKVLMGLSIVCFIVTVALIIFWIFWKHVISVRQALLMLATLGSQLVVMIILPLLVYAINTCSYCGIPGFAVFVWFTTGCCAFLGFANLYKSTEIDQTVWHIGFSFLTGFFAVVLCWNDLSLPYLWANVISGLYYLVHFLPKSFRFLQPIIDFIALVPFVFEYTFFFTLVQRYSPAMPGIIPELFGVVIMWLNTAIVCFSIMGNSCSDKFVDRLKIRRKLSRYMFGVVFFFLVLLCVKRIPYSNEYCLKGTVAHTFYDNGTSDISFITLVGKRTIPQMKKLIKLQDDYDYEPNYVRPYGGGPAIVKRFRQQRKPDFIQEWPEFHWESTPWDGTTRKMTFYLDKMQDDMDAVAFVIGCPEKKDCVKSSSLWDKITHNKNPNFEYGLFLRATPIYMPFNMTLEITTEKELDVLNVFSWGQYTKERNEFMSIFPSYVQHYQKSSALVDTMLVNQSKI